MSMKELITPDLVTLNLQAHTPDEALVELGNLLARAGAVVQLDTYLGAVRTREALGTTAMGVGVAMPHGKSPGVARAAFAFGRARAGIPWPSLDDQPVQLVFLIAAPEGGENAHLRVVSQLARQLMQPEVRQHLLTADSPDAVLAALQ
ncbi:MAG TPA: PTS sugar transporter subunit IIA [Symbiobacteriaceae bacterium]|jgi:fructose-specific phosphotransferase system IIA component|nr:PTS sugar transporter subunit IIA [Symbiobacteriaceae bacterium]